MKNIKKLILPILVCVLFSLNMNAQTAMVVNETNNSYAFSYKFKAKKTAKLEKMLTRKLGTPTKIKAGRKVVWKTNMTKAILKRGKLKLKHRGDDVLKWKFFKTKLLVLT